jgi:cell division protein FtsZ
MVHSIENEPGARIKVIGAGGCGGNAINHMIASGLRNIDFVAVNTDAQALLNNKAPTRLQIGQILTRGRGTGGNPELGRKAALEDEGRLRELLAGAEMVFVTAGMGGGTGTGSAPMIARFARESGALTVGVVTKPFLFEGRKRRSQAEEGVRELKSAVDTLIIIPNDRLLSVATRSTSLRAAFEKADDVLLQAVRGISELVTEHGLINLDFADVRSVMADMGIAMMGTAQASGEDRAAQAAQRAVSSPLLEDTSINGARGLLINFTGGPDMSLYEVTEAASWIQEHAHEDANILFGAVIDEKLVDQIRVTVIATGFGEYREAKSIRPVAAHLPSGPIKDDIPQAAVEAPPPEPAPAAGVAEPALSEDASAPDTSLQVVSSTVSEVGSTTDSTEAPPSPAEIQPPLAEAEPAPPASTSAASPAPESSMIAANGQARRVGRLALIRESVLDLAAFVRRNTAILAESTIRKKRAAPSRDSAGRACESCGALGLSQESAFCTKCGASVREKVE